MKINDVGNQIFLQEIERIRLRDNVQYMDAVLYFCEKNNLEIESIADVICETPILHARIQEEAEELNYIEKTRRLPI